ncbi:hypothetical protein CHS0354_016254 [Potamilus streckersoni]|uniref:Uncharacterized protein n=1 Tax=Potamilus streckersoni TaxID=2493646 RepID=A0AAE0VKX7_9BIVA|nr:hypothetical protein CHS0354_016254 [Potamilus streckersoni]
MVNGSVCRLRMGTRNVISLTIATYALLQLCDGALPCPPDQIYHNETQKCCYPVFNCLPGTEVSPCNGTDIKDTCTPCKEDAIQPQLVSSLDGINANCFSNQDQDECMTGELMPAREQPQAVCGIPCICNYNNCYFGDDPCRCEIKDQRSCPVNMTMNKQTGVCESCPEYTFKDNEGCGPCIYNEAEWLNAHRNGSSTIFPPYPSSKIPKPASTTTAQEVHGTNSTTDSDANVCPKDSTIPPWLIGFLVVLIVSVIILSTILAYVVYKQRRNPPHHLLHQVIASNDQATPTERNATFSVERQRLILRDERPVAPIQRK